MRTMIRIAWRRGFLRLWCIGATLWGASVLAIGWSSLWVERPITFDDLAKKSSAAPLASGIHRATNPNGADYVGPAKPRATQTHFFDQFDNGPDANSASQPRQQLVDRF